MFCPRCRRVYPDGTARCETCATDLVSGPDPAAADPDDALGLVPVFRADDEGRLDVVRSLLEAEQIPCVVQGQLAQDLVGLGRAPLGVNLATGPVVLLVPAELAEAARELIADRGAELPADRDPPAE